LDENKSLREYLEKLANKFAVFFIDPLIELLESRSGEYLRVQFLRDLYPSLSLKSA